MRKPTAPFAIISLFLAAFLSTAAFLHTYAMTDNWSQKTHLTYPLGDGPAAANSTDWKQRKILPMANRQKDAFFVAFSICGGLNGHAFVVVKILLRPTRILAEIAHSELVQPLVVAAAQ
jgi:hypothetical protein